MADMIFRGSGSLGVGSNLTASVKALAGPHTIITKQPRAICPKHGEVSGSFHCYLTDDPSYTTPMICPKCYIDWVGRNVLHVTPVVDSDE